MDTLTVTAAGETVTVNFTVAQARALRLGVYRSGNEGDVDTYAAGWPLTVESFYENHAARVKGTPEIEAALKKGRDVIVAIDTKVNATTWTAFSDVATGAIDTDLTAWGTDLAALLAKYPGRRAWTAIAHEAENGGRNPADTASSFLAMRKRFSGLMRGHGISVDYWAASGMNKTFYGDKADVDLVTGDRYYRGTDKHGQTMTQTLQPFVDTLNAVGWGDVPRGLTETGIVVNKFTSAEQTAWWQSAPAAVATHKLTLFIAFQDDRDLEYVPTDPAVKTAIQGVYTTLTG